jgi:hypothetical protein
LKRAIARPKRHPTTSSRFFSISIGSSINDSLGHVIAEKLAEIGRKSGGLAPKTLLPDLAVMSSSFSWMTSDVSANGVANRIHKELMRPFNPGNEVFTSTSIGMPCFMATID